MHIKVSLLSEFKSHTGVDLRKKINWPIGPFKIPLAREISVHEVDRYKRGELAPHPPQETGN